MAGWRRGPNCPPPGNPSPFFGVSRNTVAEVYERLLNEGYVVTRHGSGTYVAERFRRRAPRTVNRAAVPDRRSPQRVLAASGRDGGDGFLA